MKRINISVLAIFTCLLTTNAFADQLECGSSKDVAKGTKIYLTLVGTGSTEAEAKADLANSTSGFSTSYECKSANCELGSCEGSFDVGSRPTNPDDSTCSQINANTWECWSTWYDYDGGGKASCSACSSSDPCALTPRAGIARS